MDFFESTNYNIAKTLMSLVGIWPYQEFKVRLFRMIISYGFLFIAVSTLFAKFFTIEYNVDDIVDILSFLLPAICYFVGYVTLHRNLENIKKIFELIKSDWAMLQSLEELDIIQRYTIKWKKITIILTAIFYFFLCLIIIEFTLPALLDVVLPLNQTREREFLIPLETFVMLEYNTVGLIFIILVLIVVGIIAITVYSCFLVTIFHTCGMFNITGYILEHTFDGNDQYPCANKEYELIRKKIIRTIGFHIRTIKFFEHTKDLSEVCYTVQITIAMVLIAFQYVKVMLIDKETLIRDMSRTLTLAIEISGVLFSVFINCHAGQEIINHSIDVFNKAAAAPWYLAPKSTQTSAILILMRSQTPCFIGVGKTFVSSYEFFVSLVKTSMSFATVYYTVK